MYTLLRIVLVKFLVFQSKSLGLGGEFNAADGVQQLVAVLGDGDDGHPQLPLHVVRGHVVQKDVLPGAEHGGGNEQALAQVFAPELGNQVPSGDQPGHGDGLAKKAVDNGGNLL